MSVFTLNSNSVMEKMSWKKDTHSLLAAGVFTPFF
jgi:hypothetical protein